MIPVNPLFDAACCGLKSVEQGLMSNGIPVPDLSQIIAHEPVLDCTCNALYVSIGGTEQVQIPYDVGGSGERAGVPDLSPLAVDCVLAYRVADIEVSLTRCVFLRNPLDGGCWSNENEPDCPSLVRCEGEVLESPPRPSECGRDEDGNLVGDGPPSKTWETKWLLDDRHVLEIVTPALWNRCLCEGWCETTCPPGGCKSAAVRWKRSRPFDSGGCGGTTATYEVTLLAT